jgi:hypothetical protein
MSSVVAGNNQTLVDIAMQVYGSAAGVWLLLQDNPTLLDPASPFVEPGMVLQVRPDLYQQAEAIPQVAAEYVRTGRDVAALNPSALLPNFPYRRCGIGYWRIGVDFVVGGTCGVAVPVVPLPTGIVDQFRVGDGTVTFTANNPGAGYEVQWSLDDFATVAATGLTFTPTVTVAGSPVPVYARLLDTTTFAVGGRVTAFAYVDPIFTFINAWDFDGVNDMAVVPDAASLKFGATNQWSISFWIKASHQDKNFITKSNNAGARWTINYGNSGATWFYEILLSNSAGGLGRVRSTGSVASNVWTHVVFTIDGANPTNWRVYINGTVGQNVVSNTLAGNANVDNVQPLRLGGFPAINQYLNGALDETTIYNKVLTPTEVATLYNAGAGNYPPATALANLVARYRFDTAAPTGPNFTLNDSSGNANHGTSSGISVSPLVAH